MMQGELLEQDNKLSDRFDLGKGYQLHLPRGPRSQGDLYCHGMHVKRVNLADKAEKRLFAVELLQKSISPSILAQVLDVSRQTLHNYRESYRMFGVTGLLHGYSPANSINRKTQGRLHVEKRRPGTKARELEALRRVEKAASNEAVQDELAWDGEATVYQLDEVALEEVLPFTPQAIETMPDIAPPAAEIVLDTAPPCSEAHPFAIPPDIAGATPPSELPYAENHGWEASRYAGIFPLLMVLISQKNWLQRLFHLFGNGWRIFWVFALMMARNIRSIEQLKHERHDEAGRILGLGRLPCTTTLWGWFYDVADKFRANVLLKDFFTNQIHCGLVGVRLWFTDGHLLPYSGQDKVHSGWNTQRRMPMPGQTNLVTCDEQGRIVYFEIQEGHGDLRAHILKLGEYAKQQSLGTQPVHVFDREGDGLEFFSDMVQSGTPFITWEKNANQAKLAALQADDFTGSVRVNGTDYRLLEQSKACICDSAAATEAGAASSSHCFELRRVVLWNLRTNHRISVLCWDNKLALSPEMIITSMLSRWGASENTFKHIKARHPYHYHPGFALNKSEKQEIANPKIKELAKQISSSQGALNKLYKQHSKSRPCLNQDGSERGNSLHRRLADMIATNEAQLKQLQTEKAQQPERIDVAGLSDYRSFKTIDNEGKNLFDFVTTSIWNARHTLIELLYDCYAKDSDRVDLLYAIFNCHGWIRSDDRWVVVRMEPLQQPARRYAQEQLCRKLTGLGAKIPGGKWLRVEVGDSPL